MWKRCELLDIEIIVVFFSKLTMLMNSMLLSGFGTHGYKSLNRVMLWQKEKL